jgi:hypothetical protein
MQGSPKEDHDELEVKESAPISKVPNDSIFRRTGIMPTRVRVPCLISLKKGFHEIIMCANSLIFQPFQLALLADA